MPDAAAKTAAMGEYGDANPWIIAVLVAVATFMEVLDTTIANVALRYISGGLAVSSDEASWVITTYLVANSIVLCASGWIAQMFGRKNFFLVCIALFTLSSLLCGFAWNLQALLIFRVVQGLAGGGMTPVAQSILAAAFPPAKRGQGFALYGIAVVVAPVIGPTLGGSLSDNLSWHWCFLINVPVGLISVVLIYLIIPSSPEKQKERERLWAKGLNFDIVGFLLIVMFLGGLEVVFDRGQIDDWFGSPFIVTSAAISATALLLFIPWELNRPQPLIDIEMLTGRQFGTCFLIMLVTGALLIATTQILPQLLQEEFGYTATLAGLAISPGGAVTMVMMVVVGRLGFVQPRYLIAAGAAIACYAMIDLLRMTPDADYWYFAWSRVYLGIGLPLIFIPITTASYDGIPPAKTDQASALINLARNFGGSMGVALSQTVLARREQFHQSRLVEHLGSWNPFYNDNLGRIQAYLNGQAATGSSSGTSMAIVGQAVQSQVTILAYIDVFVVLGVVAAVMVPMALTLRSVNRSAGAKPAH
jgi:DHA2 family multidrug resistance protein